MTQNTGIKQRIEVAKTQEEITALMEQGAKFQAASAKTRGAWKKAAKKRSYQLSNDVRSTPERSENEGRAEAAKPEARKPRKASNVSV